MSCIISNAIGLQKQGGALGWKGQGRVAYEGNGAKAVLAGQLLEWLRADMRNGKGAVLGPSPLLRGRCWGDCHLAGFHV